MWIEFILNNKTIRTETEPGLPLLDFIRNRENLKGTKTGCREGDCGACAVLEGRIIEGKMRYRTILSCLTPLVNVQGKHIVTIEGLNMDDFTPVQLSIVNHSATQCGFCTPGFIVALTAFILGEDDDPIKALSGNICRCTGYKSIENAAWELAALKKQFLDGNKTETLIQKGWIPEYFESIPSRLKTLNNNFKEQSDSRPIGGGTDLMVQQPDLLLESELKPIHLEIPSEIFEKSESIHIGAAVSVTDFFEHELILENFSKVKLVTPWFASEPIRNMGTLGGNIVNASPIGDLTILFMALDANLIIGDTKGIQREIRLKDFYRAYKKTVLADGEMIHYLVLQKPERSWRFNFEKVSKRSFLDIASVNAAIGITSFAERIQNVHASIGGVAPYPLYLTKTCSFLEGKRIDPELISKALEIIQEEIAPISDVRGQAGYKRLLSRQLFVKHFIELFPVLCNESEMLQLLKDKPLSHEKH